MYLLDTHVLIWFFYERQRLSQGARAALDGDQAYLFVSHASLWELFNKLAKGRIEVVQETFDQLLARLQKFGMRQLPIDLEDIRAAAELPHHHGDPFDRMLIAQARRRGLTLVSADQWFHRYGVSLLPL